MITKIFSLLFLFNIVVADMGQVPFEVHVELPEIKSKEQEIIDGLIEILSEEGDNEDVED